MLATPLRPFLKEQISPRPQESMAIFDRITYSNVRLEVEKHKKGKKKPRFLMNSRVFSRSINSVSAGKEHMHL